MSADSRRIERLDLKVAQTEDVPRAVRTLTEALRLASLPGDGQPGRLFIRRLELPAFRLDAGATPVAQAIAQRVRELRRSAIEITHPRAAEAEAVFARDAVEPLVLALVRAAQGQRLSAWFWPQIDPALQAKATPGQVSARVWRLLSQQAHAIAVVPAALAAVLDVGAEPTLFTAIEPALAHTLALKLKAPLIASQHWSAVVETMLPLRWRRAVCAAVDACGRDMRAGWLVTAAARAAQPWNVAGDVPIAEPDAPPVGVTWRDEPMEPEAGEVTPPPEQAHAPFPRIQAEAESRVLDAAPRSPHEARSAATPADQTRSAPRTSVERPSPPAPLASPAGAPTELAPTSSVTAPAPRWSLLQRPAPTAHGGLFFLLHPLRRLGLAAFVERHVALGQHGFARHVLRRIADELAIAPEDPVRVPLQAPELPGDLVVPLPASWRDALPPERMPAAREPATSEELVAAWAHALAAYLEGVVELDLGAVVRRNAAMTCSRTHLDMFFDMNLSEIRIRRAALDLDPGWVPWFGWVVHFHYVFGGMLDA